MKEWLPRRYSTLTRDRGAKPMHPKRKDDFLLAKKRREPPMPFCLLLESIIQDPVYKGDNHHKDPMIFFSLTSSRIDSIRASQYLVDYKILSLITNETGLKYHLFFPLFIKTPLLSGSFGCEPFGLNFNRACLNGDFHRIFHWIF